MTLHQPPILPSPTPTFQLKLSAISPAHTLAFSSTRAETTPTMLRRLLRTVVDSARAVFKALVKPRDLALENLALRQQLASVTAKPHPRPTSFDRLFWSVLSSLWSSWKDALAFVSPATVVRWHKAGFRLFVSVH